MAGPSRIVELASIINTNTATVDKYITSAGLPTPSFTIETPPQLQFPADVAKARDAVVEATDELQTLMLGPMRTIYNEVTWKHTTLVSLHAIAQFNITSAFPVDQTSSVADIAEKSGMDPEDCRRLLRHAISNRIFSSTKEDVISHTAASAAIAQVPLLRGWILSACQTMWASAAHLIPSMIKWPGSQEPNQTAFNILKQKEGSFFEIINEDPVLRKEFADAMTFFEAGPGMGVEPLIDNYDWNGTKLVVDVGGSHGNTVMKIARRFPNIKFVVQDLAGVIAVAKAPSDLEIADRVEFQAHDFFCQQPMVGADVYLLRLILHNWSDKYATKILQALVPALKSGARVIINDQVLPEPGVLSLYQDRNVRGWDLAMKEAFNARERDIQEWTALIKGADKRFHILEVKRPQGSFLQIIEIVWD